MAQELITLLAQYGLLLIFLNVLVEQLGVPVPAVPTLVLAGAQASTGTLPLAGVIGVAVLACLLSDSAWYLVGRRLGTRVMRTLCKIALTPDSCVKQSELRFQRWRGQILLIAKFIPGLATVASPLVGSLGLPAGSFLLLDFCGSLLWASAASGLGYLFAAQIDGLLAALARAGSLSVELAGLLLGGYIVFKWLQRRRLLARLRMPRIDVDELQQALAGASPPVVVDIRTELARDSDDRMIPGALLAQMHELEGVLADIPPERELVLYCMCPNEVSAVVAAQRLIRQGRSKVRPLRGGLDAWGDAGYHFARIPPSSGMPTPGLRPTLKL